MLLHWNSVLPIFSNKKSIVDQIIATLKQAILCVILLIYIVYELFSLQAKSCN